MHLSQNARHSFVRQQVCAFPNACMVIAAVYHQQRDVGWPSNAHDSLPAAGALQWLAAQHLLDQQGLITRVNLPAIRRS